MAGLERARRRFEAEGRARCLSPATLRSRASDLRRFWAWMEATGTTADMLDRGAMVELVGDLLGEGLSDGTVARLCSTVRSFLATAVEVGELERAPHVPSPKLGPRAIPQPLTEEEAAALLGAPDPSSWVGRRDRAALEALYSTGCRAAELVALNRSDLQLPQGAALVRQGKGKKDRLVALGSSAVAALRAYLDGDGRPAVRAPESAGAVFLSYQGSRLTTRSLGRLVARTARAAGLEREVHPHTLRHSCATHLVEHGADVLGVRDLLGHAHVSTTEVYLRAANVGALERHRKCHPRA